MNGKDRVIGERAIGSGHWAIEKRPTLAKNAMSRGTRIFTRSL